MLSKPEDGWTDFQLGSEDTAFCLSYLTDVALIYAMISFISVLILASTYIPNLRTRGRFSKEVRDEVESERKYLQKQSKEKEEPGGEDV